MALPRQIIKPGEKTEEAILPEFFRDLINYLTVVKQRAPNDSKKIILICQKLFVPYTKPFYEKWSDFLEWHSEFIEKYYSFLLSYSGVKILLPHRLLILETLDPDNTLVEQLKEAISPSFFLFTLNKIFRDLSLPLLKNDKRIIHAFLNPITYSDIPTIPTNRQIAELIHSSENTVSRRIDQLINKSILTHAYRVEMARLGYLTSSIIHLENVNQLPSTLEPFCLADVPLDLGEAIGKIKIFQVPQNRNDIILTARAHLNPLYEVTLTKSYIGWNLTGLSIDPNQRWRVLPPIFTSQKWDELVYSEKEMGIEHNLISNEAPLSISITQGKMLDLIRSDGTIPNYHLSQSLGITQKYIKQFYEYFFSNNLIKRLTLLSNIGLNCKVWITLLGSQSMDDFTIIPKIVEHLKFFPFCYLFYNENILESFGRSLLTGVIWIPPTWFVDFYATWILLADHGFVPKINMSQGVIKWGIDIAKTYDT